MRAHINVKWETLKSVVCTAISGGRLSEDRPTAVVREQLNQWSVSHTELRHRESSADPVSPGTIKVTIRYITRPRLQHTVWPPSTSLRDVQLLSSFVFYSLSDYENRYIRYSLSVCVLCLRFRVDSCNRRSHFLRWKTRFALDGLN